MNVTLYINGKDAYTTYGITPVNSSTLSSLMTPPSRKERISNDSRKENGTRYVTADVPVQKREISLALQMSAPNEKAFLARFAALCKELQEAEWLNISTSLDTATVYKCLYDSCTQFAQYNLGIAKFTLKLIEPNPTDRT
jgi:hypothetical protein